MEVKLFKPQNTLLQKYIECIYTLTRKPDDKPNKYLTFPNIFTIISVNTYNKTSVNGNTVTLTYCPDNKLETYLVRHPREPVWIEYQGETNEITIYFKPLGINAFLENTLSYYYETQYPRFNPFEDYQEKMAEILLVKKDSDKIQLLENYWLSKLKNFEHPFLYQVIDKLLHDKELSDNISDLASEIGITRATLNKHFALHICKTPSDFKKIVRFRNVMKKHLLKQSDENLTDIAYKTHYFDQSHMIKDFKSLTNYSPKVFFSKLSSLENGEINWLFLQ
jgi:AraC-like DNA-binding protein